LFRKQDDPEYAISLHSPPQEIQSYADKIADLEATYYIVQEQNDQLMVASSFSFHAATNADEQGDLRAAGHAQLHPADHPEGGDQGAAEEHQRAGEGDQALRREGEGADGGLADEKAEGQGPVRESAELRVLVEQEPRAQHRLHPVDSVGEAEPDRGEREDHRAARQDPGGQDELGPQDEEVAARRAAEAEHHLQQSEDQARRAGAAVPGGLPEVPDAGELPEARQERDLHDFAGQDQIGRGDQKLGACPDHHL